ncbi:hypothetical protein ABFS83_05G038200 [Erythranthe nasuta]
MESFSSLISLDSYTSTSLNRNNRIGFIFDSSSLIFLKKITLSIIHFFISFETFRSNFVFPLKTIRTRKYFFFNFPIFFSISLKMDLKKEGRFRGEPKGSSVSIPQTVKKQKSSFSFFFFIRSF